MIVVFSQIGLSLAPLSMIAVTTLDAEWNDAVDLSGGVWSS